MEDLEKRLTAIENAVKMVLVATKEVLTFDEAAAFTGLSKSSLYKMTSHDTIPHYKPRGKLVYFERKELQAWLLQNKVGVNN